MSAFIFSCQLSLPIFCSQFSAAQFSAHKLNKFIVPTTIVGGGGGGGGEGTIYSNDFFFVQTILADRFIHRREMLALSLKSSSSVEFEIKRFFYYRFFFKELSRFEVLCEHVIFGMILFTIWGIFVQIKIFFYKKSFHKKNV